MGRPFPGKLLGVMVGSLFIGNGMACPSSWARKSALVAGAERPVGIVVSGEAGDHKFVVEGKGLPADGAAILVDGHICTDDVCVERHVHLSPKTLEV